MFSWILKQIPHPKIKHFFDTDDRIYQVSGVLDPTHGQTARC